MIKGQNGHTHQQARTPGEDLRLSASTSRNCSTAEWLAESSGHLSTAMPCLLWLLRPLQTSRIFQFKIYHICNMAFLLDWKKAGYKTYPSSKCLQTAHRDHGLSTIPALPVKPDINSRLLSASATYSLCSHNSSKTTSHQLYTRQV